MVLNLKKQASASSAALFIQPTALADTQTRCNSILRFRNPYFLGTTEHVPVLPCCGKGSNEALVDEAMMVPQSLDVEAVLNHHRTVEDLPGSPIVESLWNQLFLQTAAGQTPYGHHRELKIANDCCGHQNGSQLRLFRHMRNR